MAGPNQSLIDSADERGPFLSIGERRDAHGEAVAPASSDVGTLLCATRMRLGKDLRQIAEMLRIRYTYLVAIEDKRYEDLPGQAYAIGFVRAYADHLGLDGDEVVRRFKEEAAGIGRRTSFGFPAPAPESGLPSGALLLAAVVLGMVVYGVWYSIAGSDRDAVQLIQEVPARLTALLDENGAPTAALQTDEQPGATEPAIRRTARAPMEPSAGPEETGEPPSVSAAEKGANENEAQAAHVINTTATKTQAPAVAPRSAEAPVRSAPTSEPAPKQSPEPEQQIAKTSPQKEPPPADDTGLADASSAPSPANPSEPDSTRDADPADKAPNETAAVAEKEKAAETDQADAERSPQPEKAAAKQTASSTAQTASAEKTTDDDVVEIRAKADSWIQLRDGEELLVTRLLRKGEVFRVPDRGGLTLMTGNAGGVEVLLNGEVMPSLGNEGVVARGVPLDPQSLKAGGG